MSVDDKKIIALLFERPGEPVFMPKQGDKATVLDVPQYFLTPRHQQIVAELKQKWFKGNVDIVPVNNISIPDLTDIIKLGKDEMFLVFLEEHRKISQKLIDIFMMQKSVKDLISIAAYCHERVNPYLFNYCLSVAVLHRKDTKDIQLPNFFQCFPGQFLNSSLMIEARQEATVIPKYVREPIIIPLMFTANMTELEQKVAYFREDIGINLHHHHWHLVYPQMAINPSVVNKDRRGELFYYMHQQIIARYNAERLSNGLQRVKSLNSLREIISEGYFNKLVQGVTNSTWPPRFPNIGLKDIFRGLIIVKIDIMEFWERNIKTAIANQNAKNLFFMDVSLAESNGIDILGNMVEASMLNVNPLLYGSYHDLGHILIAYCHDPDGRFLEGPSIMGSTTTAMRDPVFYRWHSKINDLFISLKNLHPSYSTTELTFVNIIITDFKLTTEGKAENQFNTFWEQHTVDFSRGLDYTPLGSISVQFTHLQHDPFSYYINVNNTSGMQKVGYARIFMAPKFDENGVAFSFNEQRLLMIELDKFTVNLNVGVNIISRKSADSSVTISFNQTFNTSQADIYCGCGWPDHMLIPKGHEAGMRYDLFIMISDYNLDKVVQTTSGPCNDADSYCGLRDRKYPDKRSMGYPFDRKGGLYINKLVDFLTPNMRVKEVTVVFLDRIIRAITPRPQPTVIPANQKSCVTS